MLRIKEVEMVDSVDVFKSSRAIRGNTQFPNFEVLHARIPFALNNTIQNFYFKKKVILEEQKAQKEDRFPSRKTDRLHDLRPSSGLLALMIQFLITLIYSCMNFSSQR